MDRTAPVQDCHLASVFGHSVRNSYALKDDLERELDLTAGGGCGYDSGCRALNGGCGLIGDCALSGPACVNNFVGRLQVGVVEHIEEFGAKLETSSLRQDGGLEERKIPVGVAGTGKSVAAKVPDCAICGCGKSGRGEELRHASRGAATSVKPPVEAGVEVGTDGVSGVT